MQERLTTGHLGTRVGIKVITTNKVIAIAAAGVLTAGLALVSSPGVAAPPLPTTGAGPSALALSPDGTRLASGGRDGVIVVWDVARRQRLASFSAPGSAVDALVFSPDARSLVSAGADSVARVWDVASGTELRSLSGHDQPISAVAVSPDGATLATAGDDTKVMLWDLATGKLKSALAGHRSTVRSLAFSPDGSTLASASADSSVRLWNTAAATASSGLPLYGGPVNAVAFSPDGSRLAVGTSGGAVETWDVASAQRTMVSSVGSGVIEVGFSPDNSELYATTTAGSAYAVSTGAGARRIILQELAGQSVSSTAIATKTRRIARADSSGNISVVDADTGAIASLSHVSTAIPPVAQASASVASSAVAQATAAADTGAGGPILIVTSGGSANPFGAFYAEVLRNEGLNEFAVADVTSLTPASLQSYDVVILAESSLTGAQVTTLTDWVSAGGNLIAMRPDAQLNSLLGLTTTSGSLSNAYMKVNPTGAGVGIVTDTIQFKGAADRHGAIAGTTTIATLYSDASTATSNPAVTLRAVGLNGGQAAAFTYDLARSLIYLRQGNPAWVGQERDGQSPLRGNDLYFGAASFDAQADWVDLNKVAIPQADEQQRLLANLVLDMNRDKKPLPRFWYLPRRLKAAVVMAGDDHGNGGTAGRFDSQIAASPPGCSVANWECIRSTSYVYQSTPLSNAQAAAYQAQGFEIALHLNTNCSNYTAPELASYWTSQLATWKAKYTSVASPRSNRTHCIAWSGWTEPASVELNYGVRFDASYYFWPPQWVLNRPGFFTGSGMPMRFMDLSGSPVDVYQGTSQMTDESGQTFPFTSDTLFSKAMGPEGYYGVFTVSAHTDTAANAVNDAVIGSAATYGVPVVTAAQMLTWIDGRNSSNFANVAWSGNTLQFTVSPGAGSTGLQVMIPVVGPSGSLTGVTVNGSAATYSLDTIKGVSYAFVNGVAGTVVAAYGAGDTTAPTVTAATPVSGATGVATSVTPTATFSEAMNAATITSANVELHTGTITGPLVAAAVSVNAATNVVTLQPNTALAASTTYSVRIRSGTSGVKDLAGNALAVDFSWSFTTGGSVDTTPPTVTATSPLNGATNVSTATAATATFSESMTPASVTASTFELHQGAVGGALLPATVTYNATTSVATLQPAATLTAGALYTVVMRSGASGVKDSAGNAMTADFVWSFTTAVVTGPACPCSVWNSSAVPAVVADPDTAATEVGVKFRSDVGGSITGIRFYKATTNAGIHVGKLWTSTGTLLASATFTGETASGWQQVSFATPVPIVANTTYVASYFAPVGRYSVNENFFAAAGVDNAPLHALREGVDGSNGVYLYGASGGFPASTFLSSNYWVDVVLTTTPVGPDTTPPTVTSTSPTSGATGVSTATPITATFSEAMNAATVTGTNFQLHVGTATGALVPSTVSYSAATAAGTLQSASGLTASTTYTAVVKGGTSGVTDTAGNALTVDRSWSFTTATISGGCASPPNPVVAENCLPGNPASEWDVSGAGDPTIQGFATDISVNQGATVSFKIATPAAAYAIDIYRLGYYGGLGARKVATISPNVSLSQSQPACTNQASTGLVDCGNWSAVASWAVPATATSGLYIARPARNDTGGASHIPFIVRSDSSTSAAVFQTSDPTWQAYNDFGGNSLYTGSPAGRAYKVSYNRPFTTRAVDGGQDWIFNSEYPMIRWLERNGYDLSYISGIDTDRAGALLTNHRVFISTGHDEYWSGGQRASVEAARAAGVNLAFFSGNEVFWKTRWENSIAGPATPYRTLVTYKETHANAKIDPTSTWTGTWRDPRFSPPADGGRPENALTGTIFAVNSGATTAIQVPEADGKMRFWRNTTVATQSAGQTATLAPETLGYEWDVDADNGSRPPGLVDLSSTTVNNAPVLTDYGSTYSSGTAVHRMTLYRHSSGALVFGAGTVQWPWGLDSVHDRGSTPADGRIQQATLNLLADMGSSATTLQSGLVAATATTDTTPAVSVITAPSAGSTFGTGVPVTVSGTATDVGGVVGGVEVSVDGGTTWHPASGRSSWTYAFTTPATSGTLTLRSRATDDSARMEVPGPSVTVTVGAGDTTPPTVVAVAPANGAGGVGLTTAVTATFSEPMNATTVSTATIELRRDTVNGALVASAVSYGAGNVATLQPSASLANSTVYVAVVKSGAAGVKDVAGNPLVADRTWTFTTAASGATGRSISFDGINDYVRVANATSLQISANISVEAFVKPVALGARSGVVSKGNYQLSLEPTGTSWRAVWRTRSNNTWRTLVGTAMPYNQWQHVAATYDGVAMRLYLGGVLDASLAATGPIQSSTAALFIGSTGTGAGFCACLIDEIRVSNVVRYTANFTVPTAAFASDANAAAIWHLNETSGTTTADSSPNANTGTLTNGPLRSSDTPLPNG